MKHDYRASWIFAAWAASVVLIGGVLTSFHQPFRLPDAEALSVVLAQSTWADSSAAPKWKVTHLLSGSCECSRRVMIHLAHRREVPGVSEEIVMVDGEESYLPGTDEVLDLLERSGFKLRHIADDELQTKFGVNGVPLLVVTAPGGKVAYLGGYGTAGDGYDDIFAKVRSRITVAPLPVLGCAVGRRDRKSADPFRMKY